jgi:hypothetical protein
MKNLQDIIEGLLDMDDEVADNAVVDSMTKKLIKQCNAVRGRKTQYEHFDAWGQELKEGDIILTEYFDIGMIIGFGKSGAGGWASRHRGDDIIFSTDGEPHKLGDYGTHDHVDKVNNGYCLKIPDVFALKSLLKK